MLEIREISKSEYIATGKLMVQEYKKLDGFPDENKMPEYYEMLKNVGKLDETDETTVFVALIGD